MPRIYLEGQALSWVLRVKVLGWINDIEIRLKQSDVIYRVNNVMYSFRYTTSSVLTVLLDSKCSHYYGCEAKDLKQSQAIHRFSVSWNKAIRKVWCLPPDVTDLICLDSTIASMHLINCMLNQLQWYKGWPLVKTVKCVT